MKRRVPRKRRRTLTARQLFEREHRRQSNGYERRDGLLIVWFGFRSYREYLKSELWSSIRSRVFGEKGTLCVACRKNRAVCVHHQEYDFKTLSGESLDQLFPICERCHKRIERNPDGRRPKRFETVQRRFIKLMEATTPERFRG